MVEYTTEELFGSSSPGPSSTEPAGPVYSGAEVFGNTAQQPPVPATPPGSGTGELSGAEAFGGPPPASPPASTSAPPTQYTTAELFGQPAVTPPSTHYAVTRGLVSGITQDYPEAAGQTLEGLSHLAPDYFKEPLQKASQYLLSKAGTPAGYERTAKPLKDIFAEPNVSDALTWAGETFGQGAASTAAPIAGSLAGGAAFGLPGAVAGGVLGGTALNYSDVYKTLKDQGVDPEKASKLSMAVLPIMSALDVAETAIPLTRLFGTTVKQQVMKYLGKEFAKQIAEKDIPEGILKAGGKSAAVEAGTEATQEFVKQGTVSAETGKPLFTQQNAWDLLENALGGGLVGGPFGAVGAASGKAVHGGKPEGLDVMPTPEETRVAFEPGIGKDGPNGEQLSILRRILNASLQPTGTPEGGNFEPGVQRAMLPTTEGVPTAEVMGPGPVWYARAEELAQRLPETGTAQDMRNRMIALGAKQDELQWTHLDDFFHDKGANIQATEADLTTPNQGAQAALTAWKQDNVGQKPPQEMLQAAQQEKTELQKAKGEAARAQPRSQQVTKQDILNHLQENRYTLKEVIRDDITAPLTQQEKDLQTEQETLGQRVDQLDHMLDDESNPINQSSNWHQRQAILDEWHAGYRRLRDIGRILQDSAATRPSPQYSGFVAPGERRGYATVALQVPPNERAGDMMAETPNRYTEGEIARARGYRQPHFSGDQYQNTIAFGTITLREDSSGHLTAHIEQIQSDWMQVARRLGFITKALLQQEIAAIKAQDEAHDALINYLNMIVKDTPISGSTMGGFAARTEMRIRDAIESKSQKSFDEVVKVGLGGVNPEAMRLGNLYGMAYQDRLKITVKIEKAVADAPYKMTQDWTKLVLKRILRWAADKGIQRVTWNNAELAWQYPTGSAGTAQTDVSKMDPDQKRRWLGIKKHYDQTIPSVAKELARQYGGDVGMTQIRTSQVGPWTARPFVANGVVTGWGVGRWEGSPDTFGQTGNFLGMQYRGERLPPTFQTQQEAQTTIDRLVGDGVISNVQVSKFSNMVGYLDFDRRAQWNFQTKGFPSFMLDSTVAPAAVQEPTGQFTIHEDIGLRAPEFQTPLVKAAYRFAGSLKQIAKKFGFDARLDVVFLAKPIGNTPGIPSPMATHQLLNGRHVIQVDLSHFVNIPLSDTIKIPFMWSAMMHEFGHAIMDEHFSKQPEHIKQAIRGAYEKFLSDTQGLTKLGEKMARRFSAMQMISSGDAWAAKDWNTLPQIEREYWARFDEWFADQVSRWATTAEKPLSVVEKTFAGIGRVLNNVFKMVSEAFGLDFKPAIVMENWLNSFMDSEGDFGHAHYLELDATQVKTDQRAVSGEEPDMAIPERSPLADTVRVSAMAATYGASPSGVASSTVHASRFNKFYKYMAGIAQLAEANPALAPLIRYVERMRRMHLDESNIHDAAIRVRKEWRALGVQAENLTSFINDLVNLDFLTPAEKAAGVIRNPSPAERNALVTKHSLSVAGLRVFQKIVILNNEVLDLTAQTAKKSAMRAFPSAAAAPTLMNKILEIDQRVAAMKARPFFPFMRFGNYYVLQKDHAGNKVHFETFERFGLKSAERQQGQRADELRALYPGYPDPEVGVLPEAASPFVGLPPMLLEEIRNKLTLTGSQNDALDNLIYNHSTATKFPRAFKQNYTKGYSMDFQRSFARYFFYAGKYYARAEHSWELNDDIRATRLVGGNKATEIANYMSDHLKNTVLEAKGDFGIFKGGIFLWAMGYVPAAATQNLTQTPMITFPYLAAKFGDIRATKHIVKAMSQMSSFYKRGAYEKTGVREMEALDYGIKHGILTESQASELAAASQGMNLLKGIGGNTAQRGWQAFMEKSAWMFEMAEQWNRRIAYRAAYNLALENPTAPIVQEAINAYRGEFNSLASRYGDRQYAAAIITASYVTTKTQYEYARWARPRFMRGRLPGTLFVFKTYMANTLWMLANNKSDVLPRFMIISALMGGLAGIPGYEDLADLLKAIGHWLNKDFNVEHALRDFVNSHFDGKIQPDMIIGGMARRGYGIPALLDMLGSFATGVPGRGFDGKVAGQNVPFPVLDRHRAITLGPLLPIEPGKLFDPTQDINKTIADQSQRASGAVFSVGFNIYKAIMDNKLEAGDWKRWERAIPRELGDLTRTWRAFNEGRERSKGGVNSAPTIADFNWRDSEQAAEMLAMATGYQPLRVQAKWDSIMAKAEVEKFYEMQQKTLFGQLFEARKGGNTAEIDSVLESIRRFNRELPSIARGYAVTQANATASMKGRERELIARERGIPTQKRNIPISQYVDTLFPETTVDVRRVR